MGGGGRTAGEGGTGYPPPIECLGLGRFGGFEGRAIGVRAVTRDNIE